MVTADDVREVGLALPRTYESFTGGRFKLKVGQVEQAARASSGAVRTDLSRRWFRDGCCATSSTTDGAAAAAWNAVDAGERDRLRELLHPAVRFTDGGVDAARLADLLGRPTIST